MSEVLPFSSKDSRDCKLTITKILFISCPNRFFGYSTEKFKNTGNRGIKDHGFVAPLIAVHEVVTKKPDNQIGFIDTSKSQVSKEYVVTGSSSKDLDTFPLMDYLFDEGITQVTDLIMFDMTYFVFVFG